MRKLGENEPIHVPERRQLQKHLTLNVNQSNLIKLYTKLAWRVYDRHF
jgi:hypothetical protein